MSDAAVLAAFVSLIVSVISAVVAIGVAFANQKAQLGLERLKNELLQQSKDRDARRDYEYEARKRLYEEFEPLLFKLVEHADEAWYRILSLARSARRGDIRPSGGWLSGDGYYLASTIYKLMAPMAVIRLLREKLTLVDLTLERRIRDQYYLAKAIDRSFTDDFALAARFPELPYDPQTGPIQGLPLGRVDVAAEAMIVREKDEAPRLMTYGQFESEYRTQGSALSTAFQPVAALFRGFHPGTRPVLWRILVVQAVMLRALIDIRGRDREVFDPLRELTAEEVALLKWSAGASMKIPIAIAREHIHETFHQIAGVSSPRGRDARHDA
jgi:hypothetical protein